jgi:hypothetical protein
LALPTGVRFKRVGDIFDVTTGMRDFRERS